MLRLCKPIEIKIAQVIVQITNVFVVGFKFEVTIYMYE